MKDLNAMREEVKALYVKAGSIREDAKKVVTDIVSNQNEAIKDIIKQDGVIGFTVNVEKRWGEDYVVHLSFEIEKAEGNWSEVLRVEVTENDFRLNWFASTATKDEVPYLNYLIVVGKVASMLKDEKTYKIIYNDVMNNIDGFKEAEQIRSAIYELEQEVRDEEKAIRENEKAEIESGLKEGLVYRFNKPVTGFNYNVKTLRGSCDSITIVKVTPKKVNYICDNESFERVLNKKDFVIALYNNREFAK